MTLDQNFTVPPSVYVSLGPSIVCLFVNLLIYLFGDRFSYPRLPSNSLYSQGQPWTSLPPDFTSWVVGVHHPAWVMGCWVSWMRGQNSASWVLPGVWCVEEEPLEKEHSREGIASQLHWFKVVKWAEGRLGWKEPQESHHRSEMCQPRLWYPWVPWTVLSLEDCALSKRSNLVLSLQYLVIV